MAFANLGFEDEDAAALGFPDVWTVSFVNAASSVAGYDDESDPLAGADTREDFEGGWSTNASYTFFYADPIDLGELSAAIYDTALPLIESVEDFEEGWSTNQAYLFTFPSGAPASYDAFAYMFGTATGPFDLTGGGQVSILTTDLGNSVSSDAVAAAAALASGSGAVYSFGAGEGKREIRITVDAFAPFLVDLDGVGATQTLVRNAINAASNTAIGSDVCVINAAELDFFGQLVGTDGDVTLENVDGGRRISALNEPVVLSNGDTFDVAVDGGSPQTITFVTADFVSIGAATNAEIAFVINRDLTGGKSFVINVGVDRVAVETEGLTGSGDQSSIEITGGSVTPAYFALLKTRSPIQKLGHISGPNPGTGNVGDESNVFLSELVAIINGTAALQAIALNADIQPNPTDLVIRLSSGTPTTGFVQGESDGMGLGYPTLIQFGPTGLGPDLEEDFEDGWSNNGTYFFTWTDVENGPGTEAASFDTGTPEDVEDFEEEWDSNESYDFTMGATTAALYDSGAEAVEDFEEVILEFTFTVIPAPPNADTIVRTAHGVTDGENVTFRNEGGILPAGIASGFPYFVIAATADTFQISQTSGGTLVDIIDNGLGTQIAIPDRTLFWTSDLGPL